MRKTIDKRWNALQVNAELQETFQNNPFVEFKRKKNLQEYTDVTRSKMEKFKAHSKNRKGKCEHCNTNKPLLCCKHVISTTAFRRYQTQQLYTIFYKLNCKSQFIIYLMECSLCTVQPVEKAKTALNIRLNNQRKNVNDPKSNPADLHFRKPGHSFNVHAKFTLIEQLSNIHTTDKDTLKFRLKRREDFWIQKLQTLTPKGLNRELNNV